MVTVLKHCWYLHQCTFILLIDHWKVYWVGKSLCYWHAILWLFVNTLTADEKYPLLKRDNLTIPIQMHLSQKQNHFPQFFAPFLKSRLNFKYFERKDDPHRFSISKWRTRKTWSDKRLKSPVSEDASTSNMANVLKLCWNLHQCTFILLFGHWKVHRVEKTICYWLVKSWDCLLKHWLPMKSILFLTETI